MTHTVLVKPVDHRVRMPTKGSEGAAAWDIYAHSVSLYPETSEAVVGTGLHVAFDSSIVMCLFARSGLGSDYGLVPSNGTGIIDSDYRGEIMVRFANLKPLGFRRLETMRQYALAGNPERIVQALFLPALPVVFQAVDALPDTVRGRGGFGSTGS